MEDMTKDDKIHHAKKQAIIYALDNIYQLMAVSAEDTDLEVRLLHYIEANMDDVADALDIEIVF